MDVVSWTCFCPKVGIRVSTESEYGNVARVMSGGDEVRWGLGLAIVRLGRADLGIEPLGERRVCWSISGGVSVSVSVLVF